jgi:hypothetical protein
MLTPRGRRARVTPRRCNYLTPARVECSTRKPGWLPLGEGGAWLAESNQKIEEFLKRLPRNTAGKNSLAVHPPSNPPQPRTVSRGLMD